MRAISAEHCAYKESEVPVSHRGTSWSFSINLQSAHPVSGSQQGRSPVTPTSVPAAQGGALIRLSCVFNGLAAFGPLESA